LGAPGAGLERGEAAVVGAGHGVGEALGDVDEQAELAVLAEVGGPGVAAHLGEVVAVGHRERGVVRRDGDGGGTRGTAGAVHRGDLDDDLVRGRVLEEDEAGLWAGIAAVSSAATAALMSRPPAMVLHPIGGG